MDVSKELKKLRKRTGLTQQELGDKARLSAATVRSIEKGHVATPSTLTLLASALGLSGDYFLESEEHEQIKPCVTIEVPIPDGLDLTDEQVKMVRRRVLAFGHDLLTFIKDFKRKGHSDEKANH